MDTFFRGRIFFPALVLAIVSFTNLTLYLFDITIQRHSASVQSTCLPNIVYKLHREYQEYPRRLKARPVNRCKCFNNLSGLIYRINSATDEDFSGTVISYNFGSYLLYHFAISPFRQFAISPFRHFAISSFRHFVF